MTRVGWAGCVAVAAALSACSSGPPKLPLSVDNGRGSQYGNYVAQEGGETRGPSGERCVIFNWDRPLTATLAVRYTAESCESKARPGLMTCRDIARKVIPIGDSTLTEQADDGPGR